MDARLFENYVFNMPKTEIIEKTGAASCPGYPEKSRMLCAPDSVEFLKSQWQLVFSFDNEGRLQQVILILQNGKPEDYGQIVAQLREKGWDPAFLEMDGDAFDWVWEKKRDRDADRLMAEFEKKASANGSFLSIYFFPKDFLAQAVVNRKVKTWSEAVDSASDAFRLICLAVDKDNVKLLFTAPLLSRKNALRYGQMIKR